MEYENHQKCARHPEGCSCCFTLNRKHSLLLRIRCWVPKTHHVRSRHLHWKLKHLTSVESLCFTGLHACFNNVCLIFQDDTALTHCSSFFEAIKLITISVVCLPRPATHNKALVITYDDGSSEAYTIVKVVITLWAVLSQVNSRGLTQSLPL